MLSDRDRRILAETAEQLRREDPALADLLGSRYGRERPTPRRRAWRRVALVVVLVAVPMFVLGIAVVSAPLVLLSLGALGTAAVLWCRSRRGPPRSRAG